MKEFYTARRDPSKLQSFKQAGPDCRVVTQYVKSMKDLAGADPVFLKVFKEFIMERHPSF